VATNETPRGSPQLYRTGCWVFAVTTLALLGALGWLVLRQATSRDSAEEEIRALIAAQQDAWNAGDLDGFMTGYRMSEDITFYSGGDVKSGWVGLRERYDKKYRAGGQSMGTLTFSDLSVDVLAGDAAMARGRWKLHLGEKTPSGLFTLLVRKYPEGWQIVHDHTSAAE
jgi:ketosteroid isomerase-like protein